MNNYQFTQDWFSLNIPVWKEIIVPKFIDKKTNVLEIGSWEGKSTVWMIDNFLNHPLSGITCIDTWNGSIEHDALTIDGIESRFDWNIQQTGCFEKVLKFKAESQKFLKLLYANLIPANYFNFIYVDGAHESFNVLADAVLSWQLLKTKGLMCFDDYNWSFGIENSHIDPKIGIDAFICAYSTQLNIIHQQRQVIIEKI